MTSINSLLHFHQRDATFEIIWPKSQPAVNLQVVSGKLLFKVYVLLLSFLIPKFPTQLTLLRDHIAALASMSLKSHLRDWETGC